MQKPPADWVECRSDYDYPGRPTALWWRGSRLEVAQVLDARQTIAGKSYLIFVENAGVFTCTFLEGADTWEIIEK